MLRSIGGRSVALAGIWAAVLLLAPPAKSDVPATEAQPDGARSARPDRFSNLFADTEVRQALAEIADGLGVTILADTSVTGTVSLELKDAPLETAIRLVCLAGGYVFKQVEPGVYLVTTADPKSPNFDVVADQRTIRLQYAKAAELKGLLPALYQPHVQFDEINNRVVVTAAQPRLDRIIDQLRQLDQPPIQVLVEVLIAEAAKTDMDEFQASTQRTNLSFDSSTGLMTYGGTASQLLSQLLWLVSQSKATIKASPRVVAQESRQAQVRVAVEQWFQILTGSALYSTTQLQSIEAAIGLTITPTVAQDTREVTCLISPEVGDVTGTGANKLPIITKRTASTTVRVADGQLIAIGGLLQHLEREVRTKIPLLGDIPLLGELFRSKHTETQDRELTIFLAPHILDEKGQFEGPLLFDSAQVAAAISALKPTATSGRSTRQTKPRLDAPSPMRP